MSSKKKKTAVPSGKSQKPEETRPSRENSENYIMIEIPDKPDAPQAAQSETKSGNNSDSKRPDGSIWNRLPKLRNIAAFLKRAATSRKTASPQKAAPADPFENPQNEISIEVPDSEAEKLKSFTPQVSSSEKPPLTPEQAAAKKRHRRIILAKTADVAFLVVLVLMGLLILFPIFFAVMQSFKTTAELGSVPQTFFPKDFTFNSFVSLFTSTGETGVPFCRFVFNTVFVAAVVTFLRIPVTVPAAYVLAKVKAPMIKPLNRLVELSLALTPALSFTLNNVFITKIRLANTYFAVILPFIVSPLCLVLIREAIRRIPDDTVLSMKLDGASHTMILRKLVIPQIRPVIAAAAVLSLFEIGRLSGGPLTFGETLDMLPAFMEQLYERGAVGEMYVLALLMFVPVVILTVIFRKSILGIVTTAALKDEV